MPKKKSQRTIKKILKDQLVDLYEAGDIKGYNMDSQPNGKVTITVWLNPDITSNLDTTTT